MSASELAAQARADLNEWAYLPGQEPFREDEVHWIDGVKFVSSLRPIAPAAPPMPVPAPIAELEEDAMEQDPPQEQAAETVEAEVQRITDAVVVHYGDDRGSEVMYDVMWKSGHVTVEPLEHLVDDEGAVRVHETNEAFDPGNRNTWSLEHAYEGVRSAASIEDWRQRYSVFHGGFPTPVTVAKALFATHRERRRHKRKTVGNIHELIVWRLSDDDTERDHTGRRFPYTGCFRSVRLAKPGKNTQLYFHTVADLYAHVLGEPVPYLAY